MLRHHRAVFGLSDIILATLAFEIAYQTRVIQHWHFVFFLTMEQKALILGVSLFAWVTIGFWLEVYEKLDSGDPRTILRDSTRQCAYGFLCVVDSNLQLCGWISAASLATRI